VADITSIDRPTIKALSGEAEAALQAVANKYGLALKMGGASFTDSDAKISFSLSVEGADEAAFARYAQFYGLEASDFGREFTAGVRRFKLVSINTRRRQYPFTGTDVKSGKAFKFTAEAVKAGLS
jgi:hypothetical protein